MLAVPNSARKSAAGMLAVGLLALAGCQSWNAPPPESCPPGIGPGAAAPLGPSQMAPSNAILIPPMDRETLWCKLVDITDDYFRIDREHRVQQIGDVLTEGRIDTQPLIGATCFEPHRRDAANAYERSLGTLQTIRRRATMRVTPQAYGSLVEITVLKEQENLARPMRSTAGVVTFRNDNTIERRLDEAAGGLTRLEWFPIGRDIALEQTMLDAIQAELGLPFGRVAQPTISGIDAAAEYYRPKEIVTPLPPVEALSPGDRFTPEESLPPP